MNKAESLAAALSRAFVTKRDALLELPDQHNRLCHRVKTKREDGRQSKRDGDAN